MPSDNPRRVLVGAIRHEVHSFVPGTIGWDEFARRGVPEGPDVLVGVEGASLEGALRVASRRNIELVGSVFASGGGGGPVLDEVFVHYADKIVAAARKHLGSIDGIYLPLHGAMATTQRDDPEGDLLEMLRQAVGPDLPIVVSLDLHAHFTDRMAQHANVVVGYRTCPHTDIVETGERAMTVLADLLDASPVVAAHTVHRKIRLMTSSEAHDTTFGPLTAMQALAREIEEEPGVLAVSIFATQPWMDVPNVGWSAVVSSTADQSSAQQQADRLARALWDQRERYHVAKTPIVDALEAAHRVARETPGAGPVVVADGSDSPSAGAMGDGTELLAAIIDRADDVRALMMVTDAQSAATAVDAGVGATVSLELGGRETPQFFTPLPVTAEVIDVVTEGVYRGVDGVEVKIGRRAVLKIRETMVVVNEHKASQLDMDPYLRLGLDPRDFALVQAKSAGGFRAAYTPIAAEIYDLDTRGPCDSELAKLPFKRITRPLWPFDLDLGEPWA